MGKKRFIDKKRSATFQLLARDTSILGNHATPEYDRVFVRIDNNPISVAEFEPGERPEDPDAIFADALSEDYGSFESSSLSNSVRKEILELGFPDDGYNYLLHLREIKNAGGGSSYYHNPKANLGQLPRDIKAYDATRVPVEKLKGSDCNENSIYRIAAKTLNARNHKAVDLDVQALLDDNNSSRCDSDIGELEEDFVIRANRPDSGDAEEESDCDVRDETSERQETFDFLQTESGSSRYFPGVENFRVNSSSLFTVKEPHGRRPLDEQFDLLELQEYGSDEENDYDENAEEEDEALANKLNNILTDVDKQDLELNDNYVAPADMLRGNDKSINQESLNSAADLVRRCIEYATRYEEENERDEVVSLQESSAESDEWDCETIVSTYSNLDNHPGRIGVPGARKNKLSEVVFGDERSSIPVIGLRGKQQLPVDFLPGGKKEKEKYVSSVKQEQPVRRHKGNESKEEKKERKAAVKEERREARRTKKELKGLYRSEAQRAQKVAAISAPSSIHLM